MKEAILLGGAASSGNRLLYRIFVSSGYKGIPFANPNLKFEGDKIVILYSWPHDKEWIDLSKVVKKLRQLSYNITGIIIMRDWYASTVSQTTAKYVDTQQAALKRVTTAYNTIFNAYQKSIVPYVAITYASLVQKGPIVIEKALTLLGKKVELTLGEEVLIDGDTKYYQ